MFEYKIHLNPVYSCPASEIPDGINLPETWQLAWHQAETVKAIRDPNIDIIFNTAMTGDGKSLAAYLETLQSGLPTIGLYPTNELIRDQFHQIRGYLSEFNLEQEPRINSLNGPALELYAQEEGISKAIALETRSSQSEILLTNPDIFHYLHQGAYLAKYDNPDKLWQRIDNLFKLFIFDEFHVFSAPQVASILNILLLMRRTNRRKRYLFLSATPNPQMLEKLDKAGFNYYCIDPITNLKYQFPKKFSQIKELESQNWRQVSRKIDLSFVPLESNFQASESWLKVNKDLILRYFQDFPHSKGAIILNSIATVKRLVPIFRELLKPHGLTVGENTGLSGTKTKLESLTCDLVLGTSTIDVGVDFKINFLIFESSDSGNFIQRLGRLGRHDGYSQENKFHHFTAIALTPKFLVERLFLKDDASLEIMGEYDRPYFNEVIKSNYRKINNFEGYYQRWGAVQGFKLWFDLGSPAIKQTYLESRNKFKEDCELVFKANFKQVAGRVMGWKNDWKRLSGHLGNPIFEDVSSFRGSSPLQCGLYDLTESNEIDRFKIYDLPGILSNLEVESWTQAGFLRSLTETAGRMQQPIAKGRFNHCLGFLKLKNYREERLNWRFTYAGNLQTIAEAWKVQVLVGVEIWQPDNPWISKISEQLRKTGLVSYVLPYPVTEIRQRLQLPMHFALYPISDERSVHDSTSPYSIAIGQAALLLDTLAYRFKAKGGEIWIC